MPTATAKALLAALVSDGEPEALPVKAWPCPECGGPVVVRNKRQQIFCSDPCRKAHHYRDGVRGRQLMQYAMAARQTRNGSRGNAEVGSLASSRMNNLMAAWRDEDAKAGRMDAVQLAALRNRFCRDW